MPGTYAAYGGTRRLNTGGHSRDLTRITRDLADGSRDLAYVTLWWYWASHGLREERERDREGGRERGGRHGHGTWARCWANNNVVGRITMGAGRNNVRCRSTFIIPYWKIPLFGQ
eukprot:2910215-Rhodomonas_salina.1